MRYLATVVIVVLGAVASLLPQLEEQTPGPDVGISVPPLSICPLVDAGGRVTDIAILSSLNGEGRVSAFTAGSETGSAVFRTGGTGSTSLSASEVSAVGFAGGLIELPSEDTFSGVVVSSETTLAAEACSNSAPDQGYIVGGSTASGASFNLQLINPYAGSAEAELTVISESGIESNDSFGAVTVPALSSVTMDMSEIIPGRESIAVEVRPTRGSVFAFGHQTTGGRSALWSAVQPQQDWWLPVPAGGDIKQLVIGNPSNTVVEFQVDLYGPEGYEEGFRVGMLPARREVAISLTDQTTEEVGLRIISTSPVVASLRVDSAQMLGMTTGSPVDALTWLLPGAESPIGGAGEVIVFNTGIETVNVRIRSLGGNPLDRTLPVDADSVISVPTVAADGYRVEAEGPVVVAWWSTLGGDGTIAIGVPVDDG